MPGPVRPASCEDALAILEALGIDPEGVYRLDLILEVGRVTRVIVHRHRLEVLPADLTSRLARGGFGVEDPRPH